MRRIGVLINLAADYPKSQARMTAFVQELGQLGWIAGRNVKIDSRWGAADNKRVRFLAELVALAPDVIVTTSSQTVAASSPPSCRLCSRASPTPSAPASSTASRDPAATPPVSCCSSTA